MGSLCCGEQSKCSWLFSEKNNEVIIEYTEAVESSERFMVSYDNPKHLNFNSSLSINNDN